MFLQILLFYSIFYNGFKLDYASWDSEKTKLHGALVHFKMGTQWSSD
uniref:Uncharacterized protein n=1 Tax=Anguilla anguilla TaxID=7936 RepID=A0A0E9V3N1_ANGAN